MESKRVKSMQRPTSINEIQDVSDALKEMKNPNYHKVCSSKDVAGIFDKFKKDVDFLVAIGNSKAALKLTPNAIRFLIEGLTKQAAYDRPAQCKLLSPIHNNLMSLGWYDTPSREREQVKATLEGYNPPSKVFTKFFKAKHKESLASVPESASPISTTGVLK